MMTDPRDPNNETVIIGNIPDGPVRHREGIEGNYYYYEYQYVDNKPIKDSTKIYNSQGSQPEDLYIEDGKLNGFYKAYDKKTKATKEEYYKDGKNTEVKFYSEDSLLVAHSIKNYDKDELVIKLYDWEGNLTSETISKISDPQARVLTKRYDKNGNLISEE